MFIKLARKFKNVDHTPNSENFQLLLQIMQVLLPHMSHQQSIFFSTIFVQLLDI
jgi:hypothetical protein